MDNRLGRVQETAGLEMSADYWQQQQMLDRQEEEEEIIALLEKVAQVLTDDELRLLQLRCSVSLH